MRKLLGGTEGTLEFQTLKEVSTETTQAHSLVPVVNTAHPAAASGQTLDTQAAPEE